MASIDLRPMQGLPGAHNHQNACAAYGALRALGLAPKQGGEGKAGGIGAIAPDLANVAKAYLIGRDAPRFAATLAEQGIAHEISGTLEEAFACAIADARPGDTVLLAPAAASFDQFESFEARGEAFERLVRELAEKAG